MRCKRGDSAFIVKSLNLSNLGKVVDVKQYIGYIEANKTFDYNGIACRVPITDHYWWVYSAGGLDTPMGPTNIAYLPDTWLQPIRPDILDDEVERDLVIPLPKETA